MQLTNDIKSKIFGLYIGCECYHPFTDRIFPINGSVTSEVEGGEDYQLVLTPRSEITDEDAIEVGKIFGYGSSGDVNCIRWAKWWISNEKSGNGWGYERAVQAVDYLRSRGYALPYMGIDLFDAGIAIPKTKKL